MRSSYEVAQKCYARKLMVAQKHYEVTQKRYARML